MKKLTRGFIQFGVLLVVALLAMGSLAIVNQEQFNSKKAAVLSRSDEEEEDEESSDSDNDNDDDLDSENEENETETPEPEKTQNPEQSEIEKRNAEREKKLLEAKRREQNKKSSDILKNGRKLKIEAKDGVAKFKIENKNGTETEQEFEEEFEFSLDGKLEDISLETEESKFLIKQGKIKVKTSFPLSVNLETNELIVTTPSGSRAVAILPKQAVENLLRSEKINFILPSPSSSPIASTLPEVSPVATSEGELDSVEETEIEIEEENGQTLYVIKGAKERKLLGLFEILIPKTFKVSTETGDVVNTSQSFVSTVLEIFSF